MGSRKRSARERERTAYRSSLGGMDGIFAREEKRREQKDAEREASRRQRTCERKKRYASRVDAEDAIAACAEHGRRGLRAYRCPYCGGWHLTSKPRE